MDGQTQLSNVTDVTVKLPYVTAPSTPCLMSPPSYCTVYATAGSRMMALFLQAPPPDPFISKVDIHQPLFASSVANVPTLASTARFHRRTAHT